MSETPEQRARRLGLIQETPDERAKRLGLASGAGMADLLREQGLMGGKAAPVELDVRQRPESTMGLPYDPGRPNDFDALVSAPAGLKTVAPEAAKGAAALTLSAAQGFPGVRAFEAAAGSLGSKFTDNPMSFRESRDMLDEETNKIPREIRAVAQLAAGGAASRLPGIARLSPAKAGAAFGGADQALSADDMSLERRLLGTGAGLAVGGGAGKTLDALVTGGRAVAASTPGANVANRQSAMRAADKVNYGNAAAEGTAAAQSGVAGPASPMGTITKVLESPDIKPFADIVRSSRQFAGKDEGAVLMETFRQMSKQQVGLARQLRRDGFDAAKQLQHDNIGLAKEELLQAADAAGVTSLRGAVQSHAKAAGEIDALTTGTDAAARIVGAPARGRAIRTQSEEAYEAALAKMSPEQKAAAIEGVLGGTKTRIRPNANPISGFGAFAALHRPARIASFLRKVGDPKQVTLDDLVRKGFIGATALEELVR
jgi:hypothetical protein